MPPTRLNIKSAAVGKIILSHILLGRWLLVHVGIKANPF